MSDGNDADIKWPTEGCNMCCACDAGCGHGELGGYASMDCPLPVKRKQKKHESGCSVAAGEGALL